MSQRPDEVFDLPLDDAWDIEQPTLFPEARRARGIKVPPTVKQSSINQGHSMIPQARAAQWSDPSVRFVSPQLQAARDAEANKIAAAEQGAAPPGVPIERVVEGSLAGAAPPVGATGAATTATAQPQDPYAGLAAQRAKWSAQQESLMADLQREQGPTDYSGLQQYMQDRQSSFLPMAMSAALLGRGPESAQGLAKLANAQAGEAMSPLKVEGGMIDASGNVVLDPGYQKQKRQEWIAKRMDQLEKLMSSSLDAETKLRAADEYKRLGLQIQQGNLQVAQGLLGVKQQLADQGKPGHFTTKGYLMSGEPVVVDGSTGQHMVKNFDGSTRPLGPQDLFKSQAQMDKEVDAIEKIRGTVSSIKAMDDLVQKNSGAFGGVTALAQLTPEILRTRFLGAKLTPAQQQTRALVMTYAANIIHELYGAALTLTENTRAAQFAPTGLEDPAVLINKLRAALLWQQQKLQGHNPQLVQRVQGSNPNPGAPAAPGGGGGVDVGEIIRQQGAGQGRAPASTNRVINTDW